MVKIVKESRPTQFLDDYVHQVEASIRHLREFYTKRQRAIGESELAHECRETYGSACTYDSRLDACIDVRQTEANSRLARDGDNLVYRREDHAYGITNATLATIRTSVGTQQNDMIVIDPDEHGQCPSGYRFSNLQGGCVPVAAIPDPVSTWDKVEPTLARTVRGDSPGNYTMRDGPAYAHQGTPVNRNSEAKRRFKLNI